MSFYNAAPFGKETSLLKVSPFNGGWEYPGAVPPPESDFMITEGGLNLMITEVSHDFMVTEHG